MSDDSFWVSKLTEDFNFVNHNDTDFDGFKDFQKEVDDRFSKIELRREKAERITNLEKWDTELPDRWRDAKLNLIEKPVVAKITAALKDHPSGSFFLNGESGAGKTFVAYALIRRMIGHGIVSTSQIKMVSESVLYNWASRGFQGQDQLGQLLSSNYKPLR
jgi:DNA replication protein DnaC